MGKGSKSRVKDIKAFDQNFNEINWVKNGSALTEIKYLKRGKIRYVYGQKDLVSNSIATPPENPPSNT